MGKELEIGLDKRLKNCDYNDINSLYRGYIDDVSVLEDKNLLIITDWKTSAKFPEKIQWDQLMYYAIWAFNLMPFDKIMLAQVYVKHNKSHKIILTRSEVEKYKKALVKNILQIEKSEEFPKNESPLCNYCDFQSNCQS
jgi:CRISPR/Cas system-associated exonuclease Cas4 (RecB family)